MKALGLVFSARKRGNCLDCVEYVLKRLELKDFDTEILNSFDLEIKPCSHCAYECFGQVLRGREEECPIQDDVPRIYERMRRANVVLLGVPTYGGNVSGLYKAWTERGQAISKNYEEYKKAYLSKIFGLIVIGNVPAGGEVAYHTVVLNHKDCEISPAAILLQSVEYSQGSVYGTLTKDKMVRKRLDRFVEMILQKWEKARKV